jgi:hypothetical protein
MDEDMLRILEDLKLWDDRHEVIRDENGEYAFSIVHRCFRRETWHSLHIAVCTDDVEIERLSFQGENHLTMEDILFQVVEGKRYIDHLERFYDELLSRPTQLARLVDIHFSRRN